MYFFCSLLLLQISFFSSLFSLIHCYLRLVLELKFFPLFRHHTEAASNQSQTTLNHLPIWFPKQNFTKYYSVQFKLCSTAFMVFLHHFLDSHKLLLQKVSLLWLIICLVNIGCKYLSIKYLI